jgi:hypothetical protein
MFVKKNVLSMRIVLTTPIIVINNHFHHKVRTGNAIVGAVPLAKLPARMGNAYNAERRMTAHRESNVLL